MLMIIKPRARLAEIGIQSLLLIYIEWRMYSSGELFMRSRVGNIGISTETTREINTKIILEWAHKRLSRE